MKRSETEIMSKQPIKVRLGDTDYDIKILGIIKSQQWRTKFNQTMGPVIASFQTPAGPQSLKDGFGQAVLQFPEKIVELVRLYAPYLPWDVILSEVDEDPKAATEEQLGLVFSQIMQVAYPFLTQLGTITSALRASVSLQ